MRVITVAVAGFGRVAGRVAPWLRQTSTIAGVSTLAGVAIAYFTGEMALPAALPVAVAALISMAMPGHPEAQGVVTQVAMDVISTANPETRAAGLKNLGRDLPAAVNATLTVTQSPPQQIS